MVSQFRASARLDRPRHGARGLAQVTGTRIVGVVAKVFAGAAARGDDQRAAGERSLERGQAGGLEPTGQREDTGGGVGRSQDRVGMIDARQPGEEALAGGSTGFRRSGRGQERFDRSRPAAGPAIAPPGSGPAHSCAARRGRRKAAKGSARPVSSRKSVASARAKRGSTPFGTT